MFSLTKHTALVTDITLRLFLYQRHHSTTLNSCYHNTSTAERQSNIMGSEDRSEVDLDSDVNRLASGNLRQSNTVPSKCE